MAPKCYICKFYDSKKMSLYRIPNRNDEYSEREKVWVKLLDAKKENINQIRICSNHFLKKKPSKSDDYLDVDWVPNQNLREYSKNRKRVEYYIRKKNDSRHENTDNFQFNVGPFPGHIEANASLNVAQENPLRCNFNGKAIPCIVNSNIKTACSSNGWYFNFIDNKFTYLDLNLANPEAKDVHSSFITGEKTACLSLNSLIPLKKRKIIVTEERIFWTKDIQTEMTMNEIDLLFEYYQGVVEERDELLLKLSTVLIDFNYFKDNDKTTRFFTGFTNWKLFSRFFDLVKNFLPTHFNCKLSQFQMLVLTLMKLRLNSTFTDIGYRFQVDGTTASRTFHRCIYILFKKFKNSKMVHWPEERNLLIFNTPSYFRSTLKETVTIIIDCFEIFAETPSMLRAVAQLFSMYKHHATIKFLIGISMSGVIIFISKPFGGRTSDKEATIKSGFIEFLKDGDIVLADKGFLIEELVNAKNADLKMPCFVRKGNQLHPNDIESSRMKSSLRIHVERVINILRQKFNICSDVAKISALSKQNELFDADLYEMIIFVCSCIVNMCRSVVTSNFEM